MEQGMWNRIGPVCGIVMVALFVGAAMFMMGEPGEYIPPGHPAETIARLLENGRDTARTVLPLAGVSVVLLGVFIADTYHRFRRAVPERGQWLATTFMAGGLLVLVALLVQIVTWVGTTRIADYGQDVQVAKALYTLANDALLGLVPGVALMTGSAAVMSFRFRALPPWLGALALLAFAVVFFAYWMPVWMLWVLATSIVLLIKPEAAGAARETAGTPQATAT